ncbi:MAG: peptidase C39 family protein [Methanosarcinales archaeon]
MLLNYFGIKKTYKELQEENKKWRRMTESQLRDLIESYGVKITKVKDLNEAKTLLEKGFPVVVYVMRRVYAKGGTHWIVLRGFHKQSFAVSDPLDKNIRRLEYKTLERAMKKTQHKILFSILEK